MSDFSYVLLLLAVVGPATNSVTHPSHLTAIATGSGTGGRSIGSLGLVADGKELDLFEVGPAWAGVRKWA